MTPINFAGFRFGLEGRKALNPTQSVSESVSQSITKVGLELLGQLKTPQLRKTCLFQMRKIPFELVDIMLPGNQVLRI